MMLRDLLILILISEWNVLVRFVHTSCVIKTGVAHCNSVTELSDGYLNRSVEKFQDVRELIIENNYSELVMHASAFKYSKNLKRVYIEKSKIRTIVEDTFRDSPLEFLTINNNGIEEIYPGVFYNLPSLDQLYVRNNSLKTISRGVFKDLHRLILLDLSNNEISFIEDFALENVPVLGYLRLGNNKINTIVIHKVVSHPEQLGELILSGNSLTSVTGFMLKKLTNLTQLSLSSNQISKIEANAFEHTPNLEYLWLDRNQLKEVDGIFPSSGLINLRVLMLDSNELMFLSYSFLYHLKPLELISLFENPWKCSCFDSIHRFLDENKVEEKCRSVYATGKRPICVSRDATNKYCSYTYNSELRDIYMDYRRKYPVNLHPKFC